jgi:hypothetical protein
LALRGAGPESEAESARFHLRRMTKSGSGSQILAFSGCGGAPKGTRQIRAILYAKGGHYGATAPTHKLPIEDILAVEYDAIPLEAFAECGRARKVGRTGDHSW